MKVRELLNLYIRLINEELSDDDEIDVYVDVEFLNASKRAYTGEDGFAYRVDGFHIEGPENYGDNLELRIESEHLNLEMKALWEKEEKEGELANGDAEPALPSKWDEDRLRLCAERVLETLRKDDAKKDKDA